MTAPTRDPERAAEREQRRAQRRADAERERRRAGRGRRVRRGASTVLIVAGLFVLTDALATVLWQEPITAAWSALRQEGLAGDLRDLEARAPTPVEQDALAVLETQATRIAFLARSLKAQTPAGKPLGRLRIERIGLSKVVVAGAQPRELRLGPGLYDETPLPGAGGTTAVAGHRTTYGAPFRHLDRVKAGDPIVMTMPYGRFTYRVTSNRIVDADDVTVVRQVDGPGRLVLTACHPLFSAAQRIAVTAELVRTEPRGAALPQAD